MTRKSRARDYEAPNEEPHVSTRVASIICGVTTATFGNWRRESNPPPVDEKTGMVPLAALGEWIRAEQVLKPGRGGSGFPYLPNINRLYQKHDLSKEAPETRLKRLQADKVQLELDRSMGLLIPVEEVQNGWSKILMRVRARLLRIPVSSAPLVTGLSDPHEVQQKLSDAVGEALEELSQGISDGPIAPS